MKIAVLSGYLVIFTKSVKPEMFLFVFAKRIALEVFAYNYLWLEIASIYGKLVVKNVYS